MKSEKLEASGSGGAAAAEAEAAVAEAPEKTTPPASGTSTTASTNSTARTTRRPSGGKANPFQRAERRERRAKIFLYGDTGSGKTSLALNFPGVSIVDTEGGTQQWSDMFQFDVLPSSSVDEILEAVTYLGSQAHEYTTFVLDPFTVYWEALQRKWQEILLRRSKNSKGFKSEYYDLQTKDWSHIKGELKDFLRKLLALDMNVIVTARQKAQYAEGEFMKKVGETFDGEKSLPYLFDAVLRMQRFPEPKGASKFVVHVEKDRGQRIGVPKIEAATPGEIYAVIAEAYGAENLQKAAVPVEPSTPDQHARIRALTEGMSEEIVFKALQNYGASTIEDLSHENALTAIDKLESATSATSTQGNEGGPSA